MDIKELKTVRLSLKNRVLRLQLYRPESNNSINDEMVRECSHVIAEYSDQISILIIEGLPDCFCLGADFSDLTSIEKSNKPDHFAPEPLYSLWETLASGPFISIAHIRGSVNAGGMGFVAACDLALADTNAEFALSELLFGLMPACVLPFLIKRIGRQKAHSMTLMTSSINVHEAHRIGLVDAFAEDSNDLLRKWLLRLTRLEKGAVYRYKKYMASLDASLSASRPLALEANKEVLSDPQILNNISRFLSTGKFPWESQG
jgi:polyketide biosynthesis enoyl-CoA hydratase PksH